MAYFAIDLMKIKVCDHIRRVKYFGKIAQKLGYFSEDETFNNAINAHDADKLFPVNLAMQSNRLYPEYVSRSVLNEKCKKEVDRVINKHIHSNAHHPEYWSRSKVSYLTTNVDATRMPNIYLTELCCDWSSVSEELGTGCLDWYNRVVGTRFIFSAEQKEYIKDCLLNLNLYSLNVMKRSYDLDNGVTYSNPCLNSILNYKSMYKDKQIRTSISNFVTVHLGYDILIKFTIEKDSLVDKDTHKRIMFSSLTGKEELKQMIIDKIALI